jgi:murein DD-endopeptidase MepM/ murein hydrolase activator NlpD
MLRFCSESYGKRAVQRNYKYSSDLTPRNRLPAKSGLALVVLMLSLSAVCFLYLPGISTYIPFSSYLPATSLDSVNQPSTFPEDDQSDQSLSSSSEALQEIVGDTGQGDTLFSLMTDNLPDEASAQKVAGSLAALIQRHLNLPFDPQTALDAGTRYAVNLDRDGRFLKATVELDPASVFHVVQDATGLRSWKDEVVLDFKQETLCFRMKGSLRDSVLAAGEGAEFASDLRSVFKWDIDFQSEAFRTDVCKVLFERRYADDRPSGYGRILCAVYEGKRTGRKTAILFGNQYYDENGVELKKDFLRSPLNVIRVTSDFGPRFHPIDRVWRKHDGVDYGAPQGTPVWSVANGVVTFAGRQNGYGNYVCICHDNGYESRYGHLQRSFVREGQRVKQRQKIGLVGMTGKATGPHLDFQLLAKGIHVNPSRVKMVHSLRTVPQPLQFRFTSVSRERFLCLNRTVPDSTFASENRSPVSRNHLRLLQRSSL